MRRSTLLVGSSALDDAEEAMSIALAELGPTLHTLPDGETGSRRNWIIHIVESLRGHPDLELGKDGSWTDYDDTPVFKIRRGHTLYGASLDFGHVAAFDASYPLFRRLRAANDLPDLAFQVGATSTWRCSCSAHRPRSCTGAPSPRRRCARPPPSATTDRPGPQCPARAGPGDPWVSSG